jgi:hypothetical protein
LGRIGRLLNQLAGVSYEIHYIKGESNHLADFMSRVNHPNDPCTVSVFSLELKSGLNWHKEQEMDSEIMSVIKLIRECASDEQWRCINNGHAWLRNKSDL